MRVAFQGVHGAYSEAACRSLLGIHCRTVPMESFEDVFSAVEKGRVDRGVVPIENSLAGSIHQNYDLLVAHDLHIIAETHLRVEHVLMCHPSTSLADITHVRSHPQALAQCSGFFSGTGKIKPVAYFDTAGAAKSLSEEAPRQLGAIASAYAADLYGLKILKRNLENQAHNFTRFLLIARKPIRAKPGTPLKCTISFTPVRDQPGILFRILGVFALRDIDLMKIESRPDPRAAFDYRFYLDLKGGPHEAHVARALEHLREMVTHYRLLGAYPAAGGGIPTPGQPKTQTRKA